MKKMKSYIVRKQEENIFSCMEMTEIIAIIGPRQSGKTTLMKHIAQSIKGKTISLVDFEDRDELNLFSSDVKSFVEIHVKDKDYLFIDEFQYAEEGGRILKYIYDHYPIKIIITGSSSTELSIQSIQHLVGRIFVFTLLPFSFDEFLGYREPQLAPIIENAEALSPVIIERVNRHYREYLVYGGYPRVVLAESKREKELVLKNIFQTYLLKEIRQILNYSNDLKLITLIKGLAYQLGSCCNYNELSTLTGFKHKALLEAIDILTQTFVLMPSRPFYSNKRLELVKIPKFYFIDNGFRNATIGDFSVTSQRNDLGSLNENFIASELSKKEIGLNYWRTKSKAEVDFIVMEQEQPVPIEVKTKASGSGIPRSFRSFLTKYKPDKAFISSNEHFRDEKVENTLIYFRPHWKVVLMQTTTSQS